MMFWMQLGQIGQRPRDSSVATVYLDALATLPRAVCSLKRLISTATIAVRVRRTSDNAEQDIGFSGDALDIASLTSFVGANSAYVVTLYDQTGNGEHYEQPTASAQPRIVNAGAYDGQLIFDGTSHWMRCTSLTLGTPQLGVYTRANIVPTASESWVILESGTWFYNVSQSYAIYSYLGNLRALASLGAGTLNYRIRERATLSGLKLRAVLMDRSVSGSGEIREWVDGIENTYTDVASTEQTGNFGSYDSYLGARAGTSEFTPMGLESLVIYNADSSAIRGSIEAAID